MKKTQNIMKIAIIGVGSVGGYFSKIFGQNNIVSV
jgi:hypothetical protein